jgi:hypothetical protein
MENSSSIPVFPQNSFVGICDQHGARVFRFPESPAIPLGKPIKPEVFNAAASSETASGLTMEVGSDGMERIIAFHQLRLNPDAPPYMYFFVGAPKSEIHAPVRAGMFRNFTILFLTIGLTLLSGWYLGGRTLGFRLEKWRRHPNGLGEGGLLNQGSTRPRNHGNRCIGKIFQRHGGITVREHQ